MIKATTSNDIPSPEEILKRGKTVSKLYDDPSNITFQIRDSTRNSSSARTEPKSSVSVSQRLKTAGQKALPDVVEEPVDKYLEGVFDEEEFVFPDEDEEVPFLEEDDVEYEEEDYYPAATNVHLDSRIKVTNKNIVSQEMFDRIRYLEKSTHLELAELNYLYAQVEYNRYVASR